MLGFELDVIDDLPEDPEIHYGFNNTAELMRMGPEQLDRYLEIARKAMAIAAEICVYTNDSLVLEKIAK